MGASWSRAESIVGGLIVPQFRDELAAISTARAERVQFEQRLRQASGQLRQLEAEQERLRRTGADISGVAARAAQLRGDVSNLTRRISVLNDRIGQLTEQVTLRHSPEELIQELDAGVPIAM